MNVVPESYRKKNVSERSEDDHKLGAESPPPTPD